MARSAKLNYQNKLVNAKAPKAEPRPKAVSPCAVDQLGNVQAKKQAVEPLYIGAGYKTPQGPTNPMVNGPRGEGRSVSRCGSQGQHGTPSRGVADWAPDVNGPPPTQRARKPGEF
jgi:hypothetical protein